MGKVYDYDELVNNKKKADRKAWVYEKVTKAKWFVEDHKAQIAAVAAAHLLLWEPLCKLQEWFLSKTGSRKQRI